MPRVSKGTRVNKNTKPMAPPKRFKPGFLLDMDKRTQIFQALRERFDTIAADLGGEEELSFTKRCLVERLVWMTAFLEDMELKIMQGDTDLLGRWSQMTNTLTGLARTLGLERQTKPMDLTTYIAAKEEQP